MRFLFHLLLALGLTWAEPGIAQIRPRTQDDARQLIVMLNGENQDASSHGAGIILGSNGKRLYVLTANHVLRDEVGGRTFSSLKVRLWAPWSAPQWVEVSGDSVQALEADAALDLAVLAIDLPDSLGNYAQQLATNCLTDRRAVTERMQVHLIGQAGLVSWNYSTTGNQVAQAPTPDLIQIETAVELASGYSGGGVFTSEWELVGLIQSDAPPELRVLPISKALVWAARKGYPISLKPYVAIREFTADPAAVSTESRTRLTWKAARGGSCRIEPGVGAVASEGSQLIEGLVETTRFRLICEGRNHPAPIVKETTVEVLKAPRITQFHQDVSVTDPRGATAIRWSAQDARKCTLEGKEVDSQGSLWMSVRSTQSISLICYNGPLVDVRATQVHPMTHLVLVDSFTVAPTRIRAGGDARLRWTTLNATECVLLGGGFDRNVNTTGELVVRPSRTTTYHMKCSGSGGPARESVLVEVERASEE